MPEKPHFDWVPTPELIAGSNLTAFLRQVGENSYESLADRADADPAWLMERVFEFCDFRFYRRWDRMLDTSRGIEWARWCVGGTTNVVLNCIDRHRDTPAWEREFLVWEGEDPRARRSLTRNDRSSVVPSVPRRPDAASSASLASAMAPSSMCAPAKCSRCLPFGPFAATRHASKTAKSRSKSRSL